MENMKKNIKNRKELEKLRQPVECYSRIVGYLSEIHNWHKGKKSEFKMRKTYNV